MKKIDKLNIIPIGGLGAIGKNITLFEYGDDIIIVDCGIMFPSDELPGIDYIIPDFSYIRSNRDRIRAIIITHGHEDHIGALPYLLQEISAPIYATKLTIGLIQSRLIEKKPREEPRFIEIHPRDIVHISNFQIEFIRVNHSIVDGVGLAIKTEIGTIIHTGDFKIDFSPLDGMVTDIARFSDYGEEGVLLLMSDSTNAEREGYTKTESILINKLIDLFSSTKGRIIIASFASNIHRIQQVLDVSQRFNKKVVISGLTMLKNIEIAHDLGYLTFKDDLIIDIEDAKKVPNKKLVIIGTGSQGEPLSALYRMANGEHRHFTIEKGDTIIITASVIPGNERTVTNIVNSLMKMGADVYHEQEKDIHVSGHGSAEELKLMLTLTRPRFFIPVHGEYKHMIAHAKLAESLNIKSSRIMIAENGDILKLTRKSLTKDGSLNLAQIYIDGKEMGDVVSDVIKDRHAMSSDGILFITVVISQGMLLREPDITGRGFVSSENVKVLGQIRNHAQEQIRSMLKAGSSPDEIAFELKKRISKSVFRSTRMKPLIETQVLEV